ncbi:virulence protein RhuM/Fic/DOC family protein, partial [Candidatus Kuenenbacteria bacterium]|nr:virulence protein RhuM/Fic/DOC family protein [Candidatus Kuenenbacteria bacterium]
MSKKELKNKIVIYQAKSGAIELKGDLKQETIWATQAEMARIFEVTPQNITLHLKNIFKDKELDKNSTCKEYLQVQKEGRREIKRQVILYNLDAIIAVGYRINSVVGTRFRQWATKTLRAHIIEGYTLNRQRIAKNYDQFLKAIEQIKKILPKGTPIGQAEVLDLVKLFANTWLSLHAYDRAQMPKAGATKKQVRLTGEELAAALQKFKQAMITQKLATEIFAQENAVGNLAGIVGNVLQAFGQKDIYPTIEEKAAHLLYFMVKNHPFIDGNKRSG